MNLSVEKFASSPILLAMFVRKIANATKFTEIYSKKKLISSFFFQDSIQKPLFCINKSKVKGSH